MKKYRTNEANSTDRRLGYSQRDRNPAGGDGASGYTADALECDLPVSHAAVFYSFGTALRSENGDGGVCAEEGEASAAALCAVYRALCPAEGMGEGGAGGEDGFQLFVALPLAGIL